MSVVEFIFRKAGEVFNFTKDRLRLLVPHGILEIFTTYISCTPAASYFYYYVMPQSFLLDTRDFLFWQFDIRDFYPSIKETLLHEAIQLAKEHVPITRKDVEVIFHARKSVLYNDRDPWVKKEGGSFDITMGAYDGAEVCELIGILMLYLIGKKYDSKNIGLYRDDGLAVFKNVSGPASEKIKKQLQSLFK